MAVTPAFLFHSFSFLLLSAQLILQYMADLSDSASLVEMSRGTHRLYRVSAQSKELYNDCTGPVLQQRRMHILPSAPWSVQTLCRSSKQLNAQNILVYSSFSLMCRNKQNTQDCQPIEAYTYCTTDTLMKLTAKLVHPYFYRQNVQKLFFCRVRLQF